MQLVLIIISQIQSVSLLRATTLFEGKQKIQSCRVFGKWRIAESASAEGNLIKERKFSQFLKASQLSKKTVRVFSCQGQRKDRKERTARTIATLPQFSFVRKTLKKKEINSALTCRGKRSNSELFQRSIIIMFSELSG